MLGSQLLTLYSNNCILESVNIIRLLHFLGLMFSDMSLAVCVSHGLCMLKFFPFLLLGGTKRCLVVSCELVISVIPQCVTTCRHAPCSVIDDTTKSANNEEERVTV